MDSYHATLSGRRHLPREVAAFEVEVFFQFSAEEARLTDERRQPELKLGLTLQIEDRGNNRTHRTSASRQSIPTQL